MLSKKLNISFYKKLKFSFSSFLFLKQTFCTLFLLISFLFLYIKDF